MLLSCILIALGLVGLGVWGLERRRRRCRQAVTATGLSAYWRDDDDNALLFDCRAAESVRRGELVFLSTIGDADAPLSVVPLIATHEDANRQGCVLMRTLSDAAPGERVRCRWEKGKWDSLSAQGKFRAFQGLMRLKGRSLADMEFARKAWEESERFLWGLE